MKISKLTPLPILLITLLFTPLLVIPAGQAEVAGADGINGSVYCDRNKDGYCDCEEDGLKGIHIQLFTEHCGGTALQTIHTDEQGKFSFHITEPGTYFVMVDLDYVCGGRVPTTRTCQQVELVSGEAVTLDPFGYSEFGQ